MRYVCFPIPEFTLSVVLYGPWHFLSFLLPVLCPDCLLRNVACEYRAKEWDAAVNESYYLTITHQ